MRRLMSGLMIALMISGCHKPAPTDRAVITLPAPPQPGQIALYGAPDGISVQSRSDDCGKAACFVYVKDKWRPLATADVSVLPLLTLNGATGGAYSDLLWRASGGGRAVLLNRAAAREAAKRGQFDGLRIGLKSGGKASYLTVFHAPNAEVALSGGGAWLLAHQKDGSSLLLDLFALQGRTGVTCVKGVAIDASPWAGPVETALSPDIFLSRNVAAEARDAEKARVDQACILKDKK